MTRTTIAALAAALALSGCAMAQDSADAPLTNQGEKVQFDELDRSADGFITRDELDEKHALFTGFDAHDKNSDGKISEHEFGEYVATLPDDTD